MRQSSRPRRDLAVVQKHEVNVAMRIELRPAITTNGDQCDRGEFFLRLFRQVLPGCLPKMPQQQIQDSGAAPAGFQAPCSGPMQHLNPVRLDLQEGFVASQFLLRLPPRGQHQTRRRIGFYLLQQTLHLPFTLGPKQSERKRSALLEEIQSPLSAAPLDCCCLDPLRFKTACFSTYSICPFMLRSSSCAQRSSSDHSPGSIRSKN